MPGLPLAALGLPFYIYVPLYLAEQGGYGYTVVAAIFFIARIGDVVTDLPVGAWVDRHGSGRGLMFGSWLLLMASALAMLLLPHPLPQVGLLALLVLLMLGWTGINVPWLALPVSLADSGRERLRLNSAREGMLLFGTVLAMLAPALLPESALQITLAGLLLFLLVAVMLQRRVPANPVGQATVSFRSLLAHRRVRGLALPWFVNMLANAIPGTVLVLFMREVLGAEDMVPVALLAYFVAGVIGVPLWYFVAGRIGNLPTWRFGLIVSAILFSFAAFLGEGDVWWFIAISVGTGLILGADQAIPSTLQTRLAQDLIRENQGGAIAARLFALWSMLSKAAMGFAVGIGYFWLGSQTSETVPPDWAIVAAYVVAPVVLKCLVFVLLKRKSALASLTEVEHAVQA